jgi:hypothetical protein
MDYAKARRRMTEMIRLAAPDSVHDVGRVGRLGEEGLEVEAHQVHGWLLDLRGVGLVEPYPTLAHHWVWVSDEQREGAGEALRAAVDKWDWEFTPWTDEAAHEAVARLFGAMSTRVVMTLSVNEFERLRDDLAGFGIVLREITRVPHYEPEPMS